MKNCENFEKHLEILDDALFLSMMMTYNLITLQDT